MIDWCTWIVKSRWLERTFPFLEIPLNQQTKTHSSGQIQLSQSLKLNPRLFESLCTVSTLYFPFLRSAISLKSHEGGPRASSLYFSHFLNLFDLLVRPRIKCHVYHGKGNQKLNWRKAFSFREIFFWTEERFFLIKFVSTLKMIQRLDIVDTIFFANSSF